MGRRSNYIREKQGRGRQDEESNAIGIRDEGPRTTTLFHRYPCSTRQGTSQLRIDQSGYVDMILQRFDMEKAHPVATPIATGTRLESTLRTTTEVIDARPISKHGRKSNVRECYAPDQTSHSQSPKYPNSTLHQPLRMKSPPKGFYDTSKDQWTSGLNIAAKKDWL